MHANKREPANGAEQSDDTRALCCCSSGQNTPHNNNNAPQNGRDARRCDVLCGLRIIIIIALSCIFLVMLGPREIEREEFARAYLCVIGTIDFSTSPEKRPRKITRYREKFNPRDKDGGSLAFERTSFKRHLDQSTKLSLIDAQSVCVNETKANPERRRVFNVHICKYGSSINV